MWGGAHGIIKRFVGTGQKREPLIYCFCSKSKVKDGQLATCSEKKWSFLRNADKYSIHVLHKKTRIWKSEEKNTNTVLGGELQMQESTVVLSCNMTNCHEMAAMSWLCRHCP